MDTFEQTLSIRWADLDSNGHVRHSVYYDYGAEQRIGYLQRTGVGVGWMTRQGIGPVIFREEARFLREIHLGDDLVIDMRLAGLSDDQRKWSLRHRIRRGEELCATLELDGAWFDLAARRLVVPPSPLREIWAAVPHGEEFRVITASRKS